MQSRKTFQRVLQRLTRPQILDPDALFVRTKTTVPAFTFYNAYKVVDAGIGCAPTRDFWDESLVRAVLGVGTHHLKGDVGAEFVTRKVAFETDNSLGFDSLVLVGSQMHSEFSDDEDLHSATVLIYPVHYCEVTGEETEAEWSFVLGESLDPADWHRSSVKKRQKRDRVPFHRVKFDVPYFGCDSEYRLARWSWTSELIRTVFSEQDGWVAIENVDGRRIDISPCGEGVEIDHRGDGMDIVAGKNKSVERAWSFITPTRASARRFTNERFTGHTTGANRNDRTRLEEQIGDCLRIVGSRGGFVVLRGQDYYVQFAVQTSSPTSALFEVVSDYNLEESQYLSDRHRAELETRGFSGAANENWQREVDLSSSAMARRSAAESLSILIDLLEERVADIQIVFDEDSA